MISSMIALFLDTTNTHKEENKEICNPTATVYR